MTALPIGTQLNEFEIRSVIGVGGFSIVYLAYDTGLCREVAIKEYLPTSLAVRNGLQVVPKTSAEKTFEKGMRHFVRETCVLAKLRHPALAAFLQFFETNGTAYLVMPYYRGRTLHEIIDNGGLAKNTNELLSIFLPLLDGLSRIHAMGCYHLDISADNIILLKDGAPVLLDFGSSRVIQVDQNDTSNDISTIILKHGFAPIEQYCNGDDGLELGPWSDIYAVSAVMRQFITGKIPLTACARLMDDTLQPLADSGIDHLPVSVLKVIDAGLAVRPESRPQTIEAFSTALKSARKSIAHHKDSEKSIVHYKAESLNESTVNNVGTLGSGLDSFFEKIANITNIPAICRKYGIGVKEIVPVLFLFVCVLGFVLGYGVSDNTPKENISGKKVEKIEKVEVDNETIENPMFASVSPMQTELSEDNAANVKDDADIAASEGSVFRSRYADISDDPADDDPAVNADTSSSTGRVTVKAANKAVKIADKLETDDVNTNNKAANASQGQLTVSVIPWGHISIDGKLIATVPPNLVLNVLEGRHTVTISNESNTPCILEIEVMKGKRMHISHDFLAEKRSTVARSVAVAD